MVMSGSFMGLIPIYVQCEIISKLQDDNSTVLFGGKSIEPVPEKTNNLGPDQVRHKTACTVTEDGLRLEILD